MPEVYTNENKYNQKCKKGERNKLAKLTDE